MQWLIDLVIEAIGIPPVFINRGDPEFQDFSFADFNQNGLQHDLDLSGVVPSNASAVSFWFDGFSASVESSVVFLVKGNTHVVNSCELVAQVAGILNRGDFVLPIGPDGKITYFFGTPDWDFMGFAVKGWWL